MIPDLIPTFLQNDFLNFQQYRATILCLKKRANKSGDSVNRTEVQQRKLQRNEIIIKVTS